MINTLVPFLVSFFNFFINIKTTNDCCFFLNNFSFSYNIHSFLIIYLIFFSFYKYQYFVHCTLFLLQLVYYLLVVLVLCSVFSSKSVIIFIFLCSNLIIRYWGSEFAIYKNLSFMKMNPLYIHSFNPFLSLSHTISSVQKHATSPYLFRIRHPIRNLSTSPYQYSDLISISVVIMSLILNLFLFMVISRN